MDEGAAAENKGKNILTIEDSPTDQLFIQKTLEKEGYTVFTAASGQESTGIIETQKLDLIIIDEILPDTRGTEICKKIKADERTRDIPVLFLTVVDEPEVILAHFDLDVINHLTKPISAKKLLAQVEAILVKT